LHFINAGDAGAVFHVYDMRGLDTPPMRFTLGRRGELVRQLSAGAYDLAIYGPSGFYRRFIGDGGARPSVSLSHEIQKAEASVAGDRGPSASAVLTIAVSSKAVGEVVTVTSEVAKYAFGPWQAVRSGGGELFTARNTWSVGGPADGMTSLFAVEAMPAGARAPRDASKPASRPSATPRWVALA